MTKTLSFRRLVSFHFMSSLYFSNRDGYNRTAQHRTNDLRLLIDARSLLFLVFRWFVSDVTWWSYVAFVNVDTEVSTFYSKEVPNSLRVLWTGGGLGEPNRAMLVLMMSRGRVVQGWKGYLKGGRLGVVV